MKIIQALSKSLEKIRSGAADIGSELERVRLGRLAILSELEMVRQAPVTEETIRARVTAMVDGQVRYIEYRYSSMFSFSQPKEKRDPEDSFNDALKASPLGALAAIGLRDTIIEGIVTASKAMDREPIEEAEREKRVAKLTADLRKLDATEEALVRSLEGAGFTIQRRADVDPEIILAADLEALET